MHLARGVVVPFPPPLENGFKSAGLTIVHHGQGTSPHRRWGNVMGQGVVQVPGVICVRQPERRTGPLLSLRSGPLYDASPQMPILH